MTLIPVPSTGVSPAVNGSGRTPAHPALDDATHRLLRERSLRVREHVLRTAAGGGSFVGAALSCVDLLVYLYTCFLRVDPADPDAPDRDYLFLSKGHAVPALYGVLAEIGLLAPQRLRRHLHTDDVIYWHPNPQVPGVEFYSGSLGHLLPVAVGVALDCRLAGNPNRVVVMVGDGELNEGSNWEALLVAAAYRLDNLTVVVDRNGFQANLPTEALIPLEPLEAKFRAFGCETARVSGHDFAALAFTFHRLPLRGGAPSVVIADTVRGRGVPSLEARADRWFVKAKPDEIESWLRELRQTNQIGER
ncbi:MAG: transketolase [Caldilineales bacterium]|nr:transketolase [Caldilineales bacterium]MDW8319081.1 transketolase [Anaerolineae bacterium]